MPNHFLFFLQVKNKTYQPEEKYAFILESGVSRRLIPLLIVISC
jgi:hypothetical protein